MLYFTCGPSQLYPTVKQHMLAALNSDIGSISHRGEAFHRIFQTAQENLRKLLGIPKRHHIFFVSSSLESMERILENCLIRKSLHFVNGAFSQKFFEIARQLGKNPATIEAEWGSGFDIEKVRIPKNIELVAITQNETSTGVALPVFFIHELAKRHPDKLFAVDIVSSVPYPKIDFGLVDIAFFSVQKGFGLPPGLGVLIVSPKAAERSSYILKKGLSAGSYHSFPTLLPKEKDNETPETPNVTNLYLLSKIAKDMLEDGIDRIRKETDEKAAMIYSFFENSPHFSLAVKDSVFRSPTTIVVETPKAIQYLELLKDRGYGVSSGYGAYKSRQFRIANFPAHRMADVSAMLKSLKSML